MNLHLQDKIVLIVGGTLGIGRGCAERFASEGATVFIVARNPARVEKVAAEISRGPGGPVSGIAADFATPQAAAEVIEAILGRHCRIDILVNAVYLGEHSESTLSGDDAHWQRHFEAIIMAQVRAARAVIPHMVAAGGGSVVNISSILGLRNFMVPVATYSALKAALSHWTKIVAKEFALQNVRVNVVLPGTVFTERRDTLLKDLAARNISMDEYFIEARKTGFVRGGPHLRNQPTTYGHRVGTPADIANVVAFVASDRAKSMTGALWNVDGGSDC